MRSITTSIHKIQATFNAKFLEFGNMLELMESRGLSQHPAQNPPRPPRQLLEDDSVSLAPKSQEGNFLDDQGGISNVDSVVSTEGDAFIPKEPSSGYSDCFRSLVYSIRRDMSDMSMSSPPRVSSTPSDFMACSEQLQEEVNNAPPVVKVDVKVTDGKRFVKTTQVNNASSHQPNASTSSSSQHTKIPAFSSPNYSSGKKAKVVKGKKQDK
ncbi:Hypothetical predicted protein [Mytilus galloprovincialis]|uniref:Uncharacterized protein n=1 Tax=Mytilus galloprovincialis TaxID=29158 RepID=A0A8B6D1K8_MYTGA|nr:Hypothetical predicted protein [Mytilus galloprovincialis]